MEHLPEPQKAAYSVDLLNLAARGLHEGRITPEEAKDPKKMRAKLIVILEKAHAPTTVAKVKLIAALKTTKQ